MNKIILRTNKGEYIPGEDIFGAVYVNIEDPTAGRGISLLFKGYEQFSYDYTSEGGKHKIESSKDYIDYYNVDIYLSSEPLALGNYVFPFNVTLPKVLPGSFKACSTNSATWNSVVEYWLQASLVDSDLTADQSIIVQSSPVHNGEVFSTHHEHVLRRFPFFKSINFSVRLVDLRPVSGENLKLRLIITNNTNVTVSSFKIKLLRNLLFISKKEVPSTKLSPNISRLQQRTYIQAEGGPLVVRETGGSAVGLNAASLDRVLDNILIPLTTKNGECLPPSIKGQHIECKYGLEIFLTLSNQSIVRISHPIPCIQHPRNKSWQSWVPPVWAARGEVMTSDSRFSVSHDQLSGEAFAGLPGFQAL